MRAVPILFAATLFLSSMASAAPDTPLRPTVQQISDIEGDYKLRDGRRAHIVGIDKRLYITIGRGQRKELLMIGTNQFVSVGGEVSILLRPDRDTDRIVLGYARGMKQDASLRIASTTPPGRGSAD